MEPMKVNLEEIELLSTQWTANPNDAGAKATRALLGPGDSVRALLGPGVPKMGIPRDGHSLFEPPDSCGMAVNPLVK